MLEAEDETRRIRDKVDAGLVAKSGAMTTQRYRVLKEMYACTSERTGRPLSVTTIAQAHRAISPALSRRGRGGAGWATYGL